MRSLSRLLNPALGLIAVVILAISHIAVLALVGASAVPSNVIQIASALLALGFCLNYAVRARDRYPRYNWLLLGAAFALWSAAQILYFVTLITKQKEPPFPSTASVLYFLVAFPILMVTVVRRSATKWEWVDWLDSAQAGIFFFVLDALVFSRPSLIPVTIAYDVQSLALFLTGVLRYSSAEPGGERGFFRNVFAFLSSYGLLISLGIHLEIDRRVTSHWLDLCWSAPFLLFCTLFSLSKIKPTLPPKERKTDLPRHFHGLSALGLAVLSIAAGGILEQHDALSGLAVLTAAFLLFAVRTAAREIQLHRAHDRLQYSVLHDSLTGLANRAHLHREIADRLRPDGTHNGCFALLFIDLDRFKTINDGLGHAFGDLLLVAIGQALRAATRPGDLVARLGGDEFVVLAGCAGLQDAQSLGQTVVDRLRQPIRLGDRVLHITASAGIVLGQADSSPDELLRHADCAMYAAKHRGRNQATVFEAPMGEKANSTLRLETDLREALSSDGISIHYQPIYSLAEQAVVGFEALARWHHRVRGPVSPADFIPVAEDSGLILELGEQVLRRACLQVRRWNETYGRKFYVSVNVSARQFAEHGLVQRIENVLAETGLPPNRLKLEVTESVLLSGVQPVEQILTAMRRMGIEIALDDFGTGYSSLSYLLRFPFDVIKMDRSFVQSLDQNSQRADLASAIVQIAATLGKQVIAEGVETENELACLQRMHCDLHQGYLFSRPLAPEAVTRLLDEYTAGKAASGEQTQPIWAVPLLGSLALKPEIPQIIPHLAAPGTATYFSCN